MSAPAMAGIAVGKDELLYAHTTHSTNHVLTLVHTLISLAMSGVVAAVAVSVGVGMALVMRRRKQMYRAKLHSSVHAHTVSAREQQPQQ